MEVYIDDMLVKSRALENHVDDPEETFATLHKYWIKLNLAKCTFGVTSGKFLGFMVSYRGIEANPEKIQAARQMSALKMVKEGQRLTRRIATFS